MSESTLVKLDRARQALAEARTLADVKKIRDIAEAARTYAKAAHLSRESLNYAGEIKLLAERKAGELLGQLQRSQGGYAPDAAASVAGASEYSQTLKDTKTPERTAQYWQQVSEVPEKIVHAYIENARKTDEGEVTTAGLLKEARKQEPAKPKRVLGRHDRWRRLQSAVNSIYDSLPPNQREREIHEACLTVILTNCLCDVCSKHSDDIGNTVGMYSQESDEPKAAESADTPPTESPVEAVTPQSAEQVETSELQPRSRTNILRDWFKQKWWFFKLGSCEHDFMGMGGREGKYDLTLIGLTPRRVKLIGNILAADRQVLEKADMPTEGAA